MTENMAADISRVSFLTVFTARRILFDFKFKNPRKGCN